MSDDTNEMNEKEYTQEELLNALYEKPLGEAPTVIWVRMYSKSGAEFTITQRGHYGPDVMDQLYQLMEHCNTAYGMSTMRPVDENVLTRLENNAGNPQNAVRQATEQTAQPAAAVAPRSSTPVPAVVNSPVQRYNSNPQPGDVIKEKIAKVKISVSGEDIAVQFFPLLSNGRVGTWPVKDMNAKLTVHQWAELFSPWGLSAEEIFQGGTFTFSDLTLVYEISGKQKSTGSYFQNFKTIIVE